MIEWLENNKEWLFSGIGTTIICSVVSFLIGGFCGYKYGNRSSINQKQKAKDNTNQNQIGNIINGNK